MTIVIGVLSALTVVTALVAQEPDTTDPCRHAELGWVHSEDIPHHAEVLIDISRRLHSGVAASFDRLGNIDGSRIADIWIADSSSVEWALAAIVADDANYSGGEASVAAGLYAIHSGRPRPMLFALRQASLESRQVIGLRAIRRRPLSTDGEREVLAYACQSLQALSALAIPAASQQPEVISRLSQRYTDLFFAAYRLLDRPNRSAVAGPILRLRPADAPIRLTATEQADSE